MFDKGAYVFCAEDKGNLVGYITLSKKGEIAYLAVLKKFHGRGIGSNLLKKIIFFVKKNKIKKLFLDVRNDNLSAIMLYLKKGFVVGGLHEKKIGKNEIIKLRMERVFSMT
ncbi:MAG: GNAT family N-acetyltransferase [Nanoarchaeota archaeon]